MTLATLQQLRSFQFDSHPTDLEQGQLAFNLSRENINPDEEDYNIYMYVGNGSNARVDEGGTVLVNDGSPGKGWIRFRLRSVSVQGDSIFGDLNVVGANLRVSRGAATPAELLVPTEVDTPSNGSGQGSLRWNTQTQSLQAWDGGKWDTTSKVSVSQIAPSNPSNGDMWFDPTVLPPKLYVYVVPALGPAAWIAATSAAGDTALQPGNGVTANVQNEIDTINSGSF